MIQVIQLIEGLRLLPISACAIVNMNARLLFVSPASIARRWSTTTTRQVCSRRTPPRACDAKAPPTKEEIDHLFKRLNHVNKNLRRKASAELAEIATDEEITRLLALLEVEETDYRRAAVQTLGMTGMPAVPPLIDILSQSENSTVRASCAKALAAVSLFFPEARASFPSDALQGLRKALKEDPDPVTRISVVGCLGSLGCDAVTSDGARLQGCEGATEVLDEVCRSAADMAVGASAVSAMTQIGQNATRERKLAITELLKSITELPNSDDPDSALKYVKEIAVASVDQLQQSAGMKN